MTRPFRHVLRLIVGLAIFTAALFASIGLALLASTTSGGAVLVLLAALAVSYLIGGAFVRTDR